MSAGGGFLIQLVFDGGVLVCHLRPVDRFILLAKRVLSREELVILHLVPGIVVSIHVEGGRSIAVQQIVRIGPRLFFLHGVAGVIEVVPLLPVVDAVVVAGFVFRVLLICVLKLLLQPGDQAAQVVERRQMVVGIIKRKVLLIKHALGRQSLGLNSTIDLCLLDHIAVDVANSACLGCVIGVAADGVSHVQSILLVLRTVLVHAVDLLIEHQVIGALLDSIREQRVLLSAQRNHLVFCPNSL